jgi:transcriptional regulator with XRE-family HTH domain
VSRRPPIDPGRLRYAREQRRLTMQQLGNDVGLSIRTIQRFEAGTVSPTPAVLDLLAAHLQVRPEWLCGADGEMDAPRLQSFLQAQAPPAQDRPTLFALVANILALSPEDRAALLRLLQSEPHPAG